MADGPLTIELTDVSFIRNERPVLRGLTAELTENRIGLIGRNGSGKSTLLRLIGALDYCTEGTVEIGGLDPRHDLKAVRPLVGYLFQSPESQLVLPTVIEDVALGLTRGKRSDQHERQIEAVLGRLQIAHLRDRFTHQLSGGEQQLVALAGAVVRSPRLMLLDEPTTFLDLGYAQRMREAIAGLEQQAIIASHDLDLIEDCERVLVIEDGELVFDGGPAPAIDRYRELASWS